MKHESDPTILGLRTGRGPGLGAESQHYPEHARHHERGERQGHGRFERGAGLNQPAPKRQQASHTAASSNTAAPATSGRGESRSLRVRQEVRRLRSAERWSPIRPSKPAPLQPRGQVRRAATSAASTGAEDSEASGRGKRTARDAGQQDTARTDDAIPLSVQWSATRAVPDAAPARSAWRSAPSICAAWCMRIAASSRWSAMVLNKAYFLRENDPVFNGYVMKITGDSIVFQETLQDRLGKSFYAGSSEEDYASGGVGRKAEEEFEKSILGNTWRRKRLVWGDREMRKQLLGLMVPLLAFVLIAAAADTTGKGVATSAALQRLEVAHNQDGLRVEFKAKGTLAPKVTTLDSPARIVVDFPNTVMATAQNHISVGQDGVKDVRIGMDGQVPPHTRVVVDLANSCQHELVAGADGSLVLKIHEAGLAHRQTRLKPVAAAAATPKTAPIPAPAPAPALAQAAPAPAAAARTPGNRWTSLSSSPSIQSKTPKPKSARLNRLKSPRSGQPFCRQDGGGTGCHQHQCRHGAGRWQCASRAAGRESGGRAEGPDGAAEAGREWCQVHGRADLGQPQGCGPERFLPSDSRDQRFERRARSSDPRQPDHRAR